jgi:hypothetical protein
MMGLHAWVVGVGNQAPPIPAPLASTAPRKDGVWGVSDTIGVGVLASVAASSCQSFKEAVTKGFRRNQDAAGCSTRIF